MQPTNQTFPIRHREVARVSAKFEGKIYPQSRWAKLFAWLLGKTKHEIKRDFKREVVVAGHVQGGQVEDMLDTMMSEFELSLIVEQKLDRVLIGPRQYEKFLKLDPMSSFDFVHSLQIGEGRFRMANYDVYIQMVPNIDGILFLRKLS